MVGPLVNHHSNIYCLIWPHLIFLLFVSPWQNNRISDFTLAHTYSLHLIFFHYSIPSPRISSYVSHSESSIPFSSHLISLVPSHLTVHISLRHSQPMPILSFLVVLVSPTLTEDTQSENGKGEKELYLFIVRHKSFLKSSNFLPLISVHRQGTDLGWSSTAGSAMAEWD